MSSFVVKSENPADRAFVAPVGNGGSFSSAPIQGYGEPPILLTGHLSQHNLAIGDAGATIKGKLAAPGVANTA